MSETLKIGFWYPNNALNRTAWQFQLVSRGENYFLELINYAKMIKQKHSKKFDTVKRFSINKPQSGDIKADKVPLHAPIFVMARIKLIKEIQFIHDGKEIRPNE